MSPMFLILFLAITSVTIQTEAAEYLQSTYNKPMFIVYCVHASLICVLVSGFINYLRNRHISVNFRVVFCSRNIFRYFEESCVLINLPFSQVFGLSIVLVTLYNISTWSWYLAISYTTASELTAVFNTNTCFAYVFSIILLKEKSVASKWLGVCLCIIGVSLITFLDCSLSINNLLGNFIGLAGAILYGLYETLYFKFAVPINKSAQFSYFFTGLMGISSVLTFWIPLLLCEAFELPNSNELMILMIVVLSGMVFNTLFFRLISMTSPTIAAAGLLLGIPSISICEFVLGKGSYSWNLMLGTLILCMGFYILHSEELKISKNYEQLDLPYEL
eukprot:NODE_492_length_7766_cov_0.167210.p2 type:complete len:332 gc:universal NODE_492_length_7766_cov_0.167210:5757-6752(+)